MDHIIRCESLKRVKIHNLESVNRKVEDKGKIIISPIIKFKIINSNSPYLYLRHVSIYNKVLTTSLRIFIVNIYEVIIYNY